MGLFCFLVLSLCITCCKVDARSKTLLNAQNHSTASYNIMHQVDNDFDCVDIYKQPALQHSLLKNHKIQFYPTFAKNAARSRPYDGGCPKGEVPIYNGTRRHQIVPNLSLKLPIKDFRSYAQSTSGYYSVSLDTTQNMIFYGGHAMIGAYNLSLQPGQYSTSSVWVESGPATELNSICAGMGVRPDIYGDSQLRLTTYWTSDGFNNTGCSDHICPGFVQVTQDKRYVFGAVQSPVSSIGSMEKYVVDFKIKRDQSTGHWWLIVGQEPIYVGYWPKELFTHLSTGASLVRFGGDAYALPNKLSPPMGSGRLPDEKFRNSGFMGRLTIIDSEYNEVDVEPDDMKSHIYANSNCYDLAYHGDQGRVYRQALLYGGPGGQNCGI